MKISIIQPDLVWEDKQANFRNLSKLISPLHNKADIVVLPEMFNTGFSVNPEQLSESPGAETFVWMKNIAHEGNLGLCGSYIVKENMHFFNRWVFVTPEKESWYYDKRHLFSMSGEDKFFSPGQTRLMISLSTFDFCLKPWITRSNMDFILNSSIVCSFNKEINRALFSLSPLLLLTPSLL